MDNLIPVYEVYVDGIRYAEKLGLVAALALVRGLCETWNEDTFKITIEQKLMIKLKGEKENETE